MMLALFGGDEGAKSTAPIPKNAVVLSGSPYERDLHATYFLTDVPPQSPSQRLLLLVPESQIDGEVEICDVGIVWGR